jgi:hypothetical protein
VAPRINRDFRELVSVLSSERVRYLVVGGYAVIEHTEPRYTKDLDIWVEPTEENAERVFRALSRFGAPLDHVTPRDFANEALVYQMGVEPVRIDVLMALTGVRFEDAWRDRKRAHWGGRVVNVLSAAHLVANKRKVGRPQDLLDVERLRPLLRKKRR